MKKFLFLLLAAVSCSRASIIPTELTCEYSQNTVTDIQNPRLSWINCNRHVVNGAAQTAYRIQVAKDKGFRQISLHHIRRQAAGVKDNILVACEGMGSGQ